MVKKKRGSSILIVDDDPEALKLLHYILLEQNYNVETSRNGSEALALVKEISFDLILLDLHMPGLNGIEICKILKESRQGKEIPIIFISGQSEIYNKVEGFDVGCIDFITKPFDPLELLSRVKTHINLKLERDQLKEMALMDGLTKLYNHSFFHDRLSQEISKSKRHNLPLSIIMIDLDDFKLINDTFGHKAGDKALIKTSSTILRIIREEDIAGRYGGEEFAIILPNTEYQAAYKVAEKIRTSIKKIKWTIKDFGLTVSGGVYTLKNENVNELIEKVDMLLYKAKDKGKDMIVTSSPIKKIHT